MKAGYKKTEVGVIPEDWDTCKVKEVFSLGRGRVISGKEIFENPGEYPVYSSQSFDRGEMGYLNTYDFEGEYITWTTDGAHAGTVFYRNGKFNCTNVCGTLKSESENYFDHKFMAYQLSMKTKKHVSYIGNPKLMNGIMGEIDIQYPEYREQKAIAAVLSDVDGLIESLEQLIGMAQ